MARKGPDFTTPVRRVLIALMALVLVALGAMYKKRGWVQQYHIGAMRNNNAQIFEKYGPDVGFDSITDAPFAKNLSRLMDAQAKTDTLP